jgi:hypothetical protein
MSAVVPTRAGERVLIALEKSGRRLVERGDGWVVVAGGDRRRRPFATLSDGEARDLIAGGHVIPAFGGGYIAITRIERETPAPSVLVAAGRPRANAKGIGFVRLAAQAEQGEGPLSARAAAAGLRLIRDAETAARRHGLSMDWNAPAADRRPRGPSSGGLARGALAAEARLKRLEQADARGFALAFTACVDGAPLTAIEKRFGLARRGGGAALGEALDKIASVYDHAVR